MGRQEPVTPSVTAPRITTIIVSEVCFLRESLAAALSCYPTVDLKAQSASPAEALRVAQEIRPAILLLDVAFPHPLAAAANFVALVPGCAVVALAIVETEQNVVAWAEAGAAGYVPNTASVDELVARLEQIARGEQTCSPRVSGGLLRRIAAGGRRSAGWTTDAPLTRREAQILDLVGQGLSNKEIARHLAIGVGTTKSHVHNLLSKLSLKRRGEAIHTFARFAPRTFVPPA